jgi:hypothetical protein
LDFPLHSRAPCLPLAASNLKPLSLWKCDQYLLRKLSHGGVVELKYPVGR